MTAKEVRSYRTMCKKLVEIEERAKLLEELKKRKICLGEEEMFVRNLQSKFKVLVFILKKCPVKYLIL